MIIDKILKMFRSGKRMSIGINEILEDIKNSKMTKSIALWEDLYTNNAPWLSESVKGINLPTLIAREVSRMTTVEFKSELSGGAMADFFSKSYSKVVEDAPIYTETACAEGGIVFKPYVINGNIAVSYVSAKNFYPISYDENGNITECVFFEKIYRRKFCYTRVEWHKYTPFKYEVRNYAYRSDSTARIGTSVLLSEVEEWADLQEYTTLSGFSRPLYSYFRMPGANSIDTTSQLGVSIYAAAINAIRDCDIQYERLLWEFEATETAINIDETAINSDNGMDKLNKRLYRGLETPELFEVFSPPIRNAQISEGLNEMLRNVERLCNLAYGTISRVDEVERTATEVKMSKQRSYVTVTSIQKELQKALQKLLISMQELCQLYNFAPKSEIEQSFDFDDSLITDSETNRQIWLQEVGAGLMKPEEYRMRVYKEDEETARAMLPEHIGDGF